LLLLTSAYATGNKPIDNDDKEPCNPNSIQTLRNAESNCAIPSCYPQWLPFSLSYLYLVASIGISTVLALVCIILASYSSLRNGLSNADESSAFKFSWRYLPTISAVIYALLWTPVMKDVVRTEPWALLSLPHGAKASESLLKRDDSWWRHTIRAVQNRNKAGGVRWAVLLAIVGRMIASVVINPLSAGLFDIIDTTTTTQKEFSTFTPPKSTLPFPNIDDTTYIRSIANIIFNVSTSAWTRDDFTVMPFWPSDLSETPLGAQLPYPPQLWIGNTTVFKVQLDCEQFSSVSKKMENITQFITQSQVTLEANDGCTLELPANCSSSSMGCGLWGQFNVSI
jgi:Protein of unknown function (DUF3433)